MTNAELCPGCFADKGSASLCPNCGYDESLKRGPLVLAHRTLLHHGQYLIGKVLGRPGGFGITYLALDTKLETRVAIKEYLPRDLAGRDAGHATISAHSAEDGEFFRYGLTQFLQEARTLAQFDHANIVRVRNFFEENSTGYLVMDYYDGVTLADYLTQQPQGRLSEKTAVGILMPILDGLREVHAKNFLHRDIKPQNIYLTTGNRPILLDFGAARQAMGERSRSLSVVLSEGYAPYEQYHRRGEQGPWTDIYACAAVLYHAVAGEAPPPATERMHKDELDIAALGVSASLANALRLGLAADHHNRTQRMTEFQALLMEDREPSSAVRVEHLPLTDEPSSANNMIVPSLNEQTPDNRPSYWWVHVLVVIIGICVVMLAIEAKKEDKATPIASTSGPVVATTEIKQASVGKLYAESGAVSYKEETRGMTMSTDYVHIVPTVVAIVDGKRLEVQGDPPSPVSLVAQKDFNGDGVMDALISITENWGGSGQHEETRFITIADGKIVMALVASGKVVEEGGRFLIKAESDDATEYWGFDGKKANKVRTIPHRKLEAFVEIKNEDDDTGTLEADLDMDGKPDKISCHFWSRWSVYTSCTLPLPGGATQEVKFEGSYCERVGALKTQSKGYRELVCNNNAVIRFNGKAWVRLAPAP